MPKVPDESLSNSIRSISVSGSRKNPSLKKNVLITLLFIVASLEIGSYFLPKDNYLVFWYPLFSSLELLFLSLIPLISFWNKSCWYTRIATVSFSTTQLINALAILLCSDQCLYIQITTHILLVSCMFAAFLAILKLLNKE